MKELIVSLCFLSFAFSSYVQAYNVPSENNTVVNENTSWSVASRNMMDGSIARTDYYYFNGDSTVGEHSYKKLFSCNDKLHENCRYEGLMREQDKKTYLRWTADGIDTEFLLYDFSLEDGISYEYKDPWGYEMTFYVRVDFVDIDDSPKKRIQLFQEPDFEGAFDTWIEGIGSLGGILHPAFFTMVGSLYYLLCCYENNELIYKNPDFSECYYDGTLNSVQKIVNNGYAIYPNPVNDLVFIFTDHGGDLEIRDISGRLVARSKLSDGMNEIPAAHFPGGIYFLKIRNKDNRIQTFKMMKL